MSFVRVRSPLLSGLLLREAYVEQGVSVCVDIAAAFEKAGVTSRRLVPLSQNRPPAPSRRLSLWVTWQGTILCTMLHFQAREGDSNGKSHGYQPVSGSWQRTMPREEHIQTVPAIAPPIFVGEALMQHPIFASRGCGACARLSPGPHYWDAKLPARTRRKTASPTPPAVMMETSRRSFHCPHVQPVRLERDQITPSDR